MRTADARFRIEDTQNESPGFLEVGAPAPPGKVGERLLWAVGGLVIGIAATAASWYYTPPPTEADELRLEISSPATTAPTSIALSPDGRTIVFSAISGAKEQLWLRSLNSSATKALEGTDGGAFPFWSPDSQSIGFFAGTHLKRIDVESGAVQTLATAENPRGGAWNRDDTILFTPGPASPVLRVPATGGSPAPVTQITAETQNHRFPQVLPDGANWLGRINHLQEATWAS